MTQRFWITVLGTVFGLQALRAFFPLLLYVLKDRFGLPSIHLGLIGIALFALGFAMPRWVRGPHGWFRAFVLLLLGRAALQLWPGDPAVSLAFAAATVAGFLAFLASLASAQRTGFALGALADCAIHAVFGTRDLHWGGWAEDVVTGALLGIGLALARAARRIPPTDGALPRAAGLLAWGPYLLLHLELLGNVARHSARTALPTAWSGTLVAAGFALALLLWPRLVRAPLAAFVALLAALLAAGGAGLGSIAVLLVLQLAAIALLMQSLTPAASPPAASSPTAPPPAGRRGAFFGAGSVLLLILLFLHYAGYDLPLPFDRGHVALAAAALLGFTALRAPKTAAPWAAPRALPIVAAVLALLPLARGVPRSAPPAKDPAATVVVSFNFHAGFDEQGGWAFDRMLRELKAARPDVAALQEASRGWVVNGCADLYELTRESLGMHGVHGPTVGTDWGSAVFTREPIGPARTTRLPPPSLRLSRGITAVERGEPGASPRLILATHLHHREAEPALRELQARAIADAFPASPDAVLLGDFNALPDAETMRILHEAGWIDAAGPPETARLAPTYPSRDPVRRIDTILLGDASRVLDCGVAPPWGSDHRAVIARFAPWGSPLSSPGAAPSAQP